MNASRLSFAHLQLLDSALPVGAFAHSWGLEAGVDSGDIATAHELEEHVRAMLHARWAPTDALFVGGVHDLAAAGELDDLWRLAIRAHVLVPASRTREGSVAIGRRLLRLLPELHGEIDVGALATAIDDGDAPSTHQLVHGWATWRLGVTRDDAARGWLFASVSTCVQAAVRLMALGQTDAQRIIARVVDELDAAWDHVRSRDVKALSSCAVQADIWAMRQPRLDGRLFMS